MRLLVLYIVGGVYVQNNIVKNVNVDDWTAERAIVASNDGSTMCKIWIFLCMTLLVISNGCIFSSLQKL